MSRKTSLYLQKAVETCGVSRDGISGFVLFSTLTVPIKSNRFSCQKKRSDNTYWHDNHESSHFIKLPLYRALKNSFHLVQKAIQRWRNQDLRSHWVLVLVCLFWRWFQCLIALQVSICSLLPMPAHQVSSPVFLCLVVIDDKRPSENYIFVSWRCLLLKGLIHSLAAGAGQPSEGHMKAICCPGLPSSEEVSQARNSAEILNRPKQNP